MIGHLTKSSIGITASKKRIKGDYSTHWHDFYEIEFILDGSGTYIIDGVDYPIEKGMLFFMTPVSFHALKNSDAEIINVMFPDDSCNRNTIFSLIDSDINTAFELNRDFDVLLTLFNELIFAAEHRHDKYAASVLDCILYKLEISQKYINSASLTHTQMLRLYIQKNFRSDITLSSAAAFAGLSAPYASSLLHAETGMTFKQQLNALRFDYAKKLLIYSDLSVMQICHESGFCDYANFLRRFKKHFGVTPTDLRKDNV